MTTQELKSLAEGGDVNAMMALGEHYYNKYQQDDFPLAAQKALPWYTLAGRSGDVEGAIRAMILGSAQILMAKEAAQWNEMSKYSAEISGISVEFLRNEKLANSDAYDEIIKCMDICLYATSISSYLMEDFAEAVEGLEGIEPGSEYYGMAQVLLGICLSDMDRDLEGTERLMILHNDMKGILTPTPDTVDEEILERGTLYLALYYRMLERKPGKAYELINRALEVIEEPDVRGILLDELAHYKKRLFGGYTYVE